MALVLSEPMPPYIAFEGPLAGVFSEMTIRGYSPLSVADILLARLALGRSLPNWYASFHTSDAFLLQPDGGLTVLRNYPAHIDCTSLSPLTALDRDCAHIYDSLPGESFSPSDTYRYLTFPHRSTSEVVSNPIWNAVVGDTALLSLYATHVLRSRPDFLTDHGCLAISAESAPHSRPMLAPLVLCGLPHRSSLEARTISEARTRVAGANHNGLANLETLYAHYRGWHTIPCTGT